MKTKAKFKKLKGIIHAVALFYFFTVSVHAGITSGPGAGSAKIENPLKVDNFLSLINLLIDGLMRVGLVAAACFIIYSGFLFVTARGDQGKITKAKENFFWTIIGAAIILGAKVIVAMITGTLKSF